MTMHVNFELRVGAETVSEELLPIALEAYPEAFTAADELDGWLVLGDGSSALRIEDTLHALILNLCIRPLTALRRGEAVEVLLFSSSDEVALRPEGDSIVVVGPDGSELRAERRELLAALEGCGRRYLAYLEQLERVEEAAYFKGELEQS